MRIPLAGHLGTKLMALILGIALWGFAFMQNLKDAPIPYVVHFSVPEGLVATPEEQQITVKVRGPRRVVDSIVRKSLIEVTVPVDGEIEDSQRIPVTVTPEDLGVQSGLIYFDLPTTIQVDVTRYATVSKPVKLQTVGTPLEGNTLSLEQTRIWPPAVDVTGPKRLVDAIESILTKPINLANRYYRDETLPFDLETAIDGQSVRVRPERVAVTLAFERKAITREFKDVPVELRLRPGWPYNAKPDRATVTVTIKGPETVVATLEPGSIVVYVAMAADDLPRATPYSKPALVDVPPAVWGRVAPEDIVVTPPNISVEVSAPQP